MPSLMIPEIAYTHGGVFHADDVFAAAFLKHLNPKIEIRRVFEIDESIKKEADSSNGRVIVFDIGGGKFDHHTKECMEFRNPEKKWNPYASFGKIVREYQQFVFPSEKEYKIFDSNLCFTIDMQDCNGSLLHGISNELSLAISSFNPTWLENASPEGYMRQFNIAVDIAEAIIKRYIEKAIAIARSEHDIEEDIAKSKDGVFFLVMDHYVNYNSYILRCERRFNWVIYPSKRGGYQLYSVVDKGTNRQLMNPAMIAYLRNEPDTIFVHDGGFTAVFKTLDSAISAAEILDNMYLREQEKA